MVVRPEDTCPDPFSDVLPGEAGSWSAFEARLRVHGK